jgi:hypothetical protein
VTHYSPDCDWDIFISYPNEADVPGVDNAGWVSTFCNYFKNKISLKTRHDVRTYYDREQLGASDHLESDILKAARKSFIFVPILSPRYFAQGKFAWQELKAFCEGRDVTGRIFPIYIEPVARPDRDPSVRGLKENKFYKGQGDRTATLAPNEYIVELQHIAGQIVRRLSPVATLSGKTIWLAEREASLKEEWEQIRGYLEDELRLNVLPAYDYPADPERLRSEVESDLKKADIFVQLLSPEDEVLHHDEHPGDISRAQLQSDAAKRENQRRWKDNGNGGQRISGLLQWRKPVRPGIFKYWNEALLNGPDVIAGSLADLKLDIVAKFEELKKPEVVEEKKAPDGNAQVEKKLLFINAAQDDKAIADDLFQRALKLLGNNPLWTAKRSPYEGTPEELQQALDDNLALCNAVWLVYGRLRASWVDRQLSYFSKILPRRKAPLAKEQRPILLVPPSEPRDIFYSSADNLTVNLQNGITDDSVRELIDQIVRTR